MTPGEQDALADPVDAVPAMQAPPGSAAKPTCGACGSPMSLAPAEHVENGMSANSAESRSDSRAPCELRGPAAYWCWYCGEY